MENLGGYIRNSLMGIPSLIYNHYPYRIQKISFLRYDVLDQFKIDLEKAKNKVTLICGSFGCEDHADLENNGFEEIAGKLAAVGVKILVVSDEDPPNFIKKLADSKQIIFKRALSIPFVGYLIDGKLIHVSYEKNRGGIFHTGNYWRTERAMTDIFELLEDMLLSGITENSKQLE